MDFMKKILIVSSFLLLHTLVISPMSLKDWNAKHTKLTTILGKTKLENFPTAKEWTSYWPIFLCDAVSDDSKNMHLEEQDPQDGRTDRGRKLRINNLYMLAKREFTSPSNTVYHYIKEETPSNKPHPPTIKWLGFCRYTYELESEKGYGSTVLRVYKNSQVCTPLPLPEEILMTYLNCQPKSPTCVLDQHVIDIN